MTRENEDNDSIIVIPLGLIALYLLLKSKKVEIPIIPKPIIETTKDFTPSTLTLRGITDLGTGSNPALYMSGNVLKMIVGYDSSIHGFSFRGDIWIQDDSEIPILPVSSFPHPTIFDNNSKMIIGIANGSTLGYIYETGKWVLDSSVVNGILSYGNYLRPTVFNFRGIQTMIAYPNVSYPIGLKFIDGTWIIDNIITTGLPQMSRGEPEVTTIGDIYTIFIGKNNGYVDIYELDELNETWIYLKTIYIKPIESDSNVLYSISPSVINYNNENVVITGNSYGTFEVSQYDEIIQV